jgi:para-nitrobenzyl esterase
MSHQRVDRRRLLAAAGGLGLVGHAAAAQAANPLKWLKPKDKKGPGAGGGKADAVGPVVDTRSGKLRGQALEGCVVFRGVPYGAPTGGPNRFRPPQPRALWPGVRDATQFGNISPQPVMPVIPEENDSQAHEPQGEDCLMLNVWTPQTGAGRRPVMVWFHGGGYAVGGGSAPWYHGERLAARHDVVVVSVNHRLNVFGFLYLADLNPAFAESANVGMLDCVAALEWVRDNISAFGGDPQNVTIFGESGGAGKVSCLLGMPGARGLFHRAVAQSGAALRLGRPEPATGSAKALLDKLGIAPSDTARIQSIPAEDIVKAIGAGAMAFTPVVDGRSMPRDPFTPAAPEVSADVPLMMGSNLTESTFFLDTPLDPLNDDELHAHVKGYCKLDDETARQVVALYRQEHPSRDNVFLYQLISSEYWMRTEVLTQAQRKAEAGRAPCYVYQFNRLAAARGGKLHCPHGSEIPYAFDNIAAARELTGTAPAAQILADKMSAAWVAFARHGDPNLGGADIPYWPAYAASRAVMAFDDECSVQLDPDGKARKVIAELKARNLAQA